MVRTKEDRSEIKSIQQEETAREGFSLSLAIIVQSIYFAFLLSLQIFLANPGMPFGYIVSVSSGTTKNDSSTAAAGAGPIASGRC